MVQGGSHLFDPFRALGLVADQVPMHVQVRGKQQFVTIAIGNAFHIYNVDKLKLLFVSPSLEEPITALVSDQDHTFVASGSHIYVFHRARLQYHLTKGDSRVHTLLMHGGHLVSVNDANTVHVWDLTTRSVDTTLTLDASSCRIVAVIHPPTYVDKLLFGLHSGALHLYNLRTSMLIHEFTADPARGSVTCLVPSPALDVVAIGYASGTVVLHHLRYDTPLCVFHTASPVQTIAFSPESHLMACTLLQGDLVFFDLHQKRLLHRQNPINSRYPTHSLYFLPNSRLLTASADNSLRLFQQDANGHLHPGAVRSGPSCAVTALSFYGHASDAHVPFLLAGSQDGSLRLLSLVRDAHNMAFSTKSLSTTLSAITQIAVQPLRRHDWCSIVTAHAASNVAVAWHAEKKAAQTLLASRDHSAVTCVAISACGHFVGLGCVSGRIDVYHLQSVRYKKSYVAMATGDTQRGISALCVDHSNRYVIAATRAGHLYFLDAMGVPSDRTQHSVTFSSAITQLVLHPEMDVLAIVLESGRVHLYDIPAQTTMRVFDVHARVCAVTFSADGRWLVTASLDQIVRVYDIPAQMLLDAWRMPDARWIRALAFSPAGDYLATCHVDTRAVYLWSNRTMLSERVSHRLCDTGQVITMSWPLSYADEEEEREGDKEEKKEEKETDHTPNPLESIYSSPAQLGSLWTLSGAPKSQWQNLLSLALIKARNKPTAPVKAPEKAPFFLPTQAGKKDIAFQIEEEKEKEEKEEEEEENRVALYPLMDSALATCLQKGEYGKAVEGLLSASPVAVDVALRTLSPMGDYGLWRAFLRALQEAGRGHRHFELLQSYLSAFLRMHGEEMARNIELFRPELVALMAQQQLQWQHLEGLFDETLCLIDYCRQVSRRV